MLKVLCDLCAVDMVVLLCVTISGKMNHLPQNSVFCLSQHVVLYIIVQKGTPEAEVF